MGDKDTAAQTPDAKHAGPRLGPDGKPLADEFGGPKGPEPTRYGDWDVNGRLTDF